MGRDMFTIIKDTKADKIIWASCKLTGIDYEYDHGETGFCGRYEETNAIAYQCDNETGLCDITTDADFERIFDRLGELADDNRATRQLIRDRLEDLREARRHAPNTEAFCDFTELYEEWNRDFNEEYWYRAEDMRQLMADTRTKFFEYQAKLGDEVDLHMYWVNDE